MAYTSKELPKVCEIDGKTLIQPPIYVCCTCNKSMCAECWKVHYPCHATVQTAWPEYLK